jgi:hypothetical protein
MQSSRCYTFMHGIGDQLGAVPLVPRSPQGGLARYRATNGRAAYGRAGKVVGRCTFHPLSGNQASDSRRCGITPPEERVRGCAAPRRLGLGFGWPPRCRREAKALAWPRRAYQSSRKSICPGNISSWRRRKRLRRGPTKLTSPQMPPRGSIRCDPIASDREFSHSLGPPARAHYTSVI